MKNNKLLKILWGVVLAIFVVCIVFLGYSYFAGGDSKKSEKSSAQTSNKKQDKNNMPMAYIYKGGYLVAQLKRQKQADWATR